MMSSCSVLSDKRDTFSIKIISDDSIFLNKNLVSIEELTASLLAAKQRNPEAVNNFVALKIVGDKLTMGTVSDVKKALRKTGFLKLRYKIEK